MDGAASGPSQAVGGEGDSGDDDHALYGVFEGARDALKVEQGEERLERQRTGHGGGDRATPAAEHGAAEHDRGDVLELEPAADLGGDAAEAAQQDAGQRGADPGQ